MTTVLFVHGTGVRKDAYAKAFNDVRQRCSGARLHQCYWGELGSRLAKKSVPTYDTARPGTKWVAPAAAEGDYLVALWGLLYEDPLYELRVLSLRQTAGGELAPNQLPPGRALAEKVNRLQVTPDLRELLAQADIEKEFEQARAAIAGLEVLRSALAGAPAALADYRAAIARALIAEAASYTTERALPSSVFTDAELRDALERLLVQKLGGAEYFVGGWVKEQLGGFVLSVGSWWMKRRRGTITDASTPAAGDILFYQARGEGIQNHIAKRIAETERPRVVLAHSLGGIACVDLFVKQECEVDLFVTAGSQAPFLYEIDALQSLRFGEPLPKHFPSWLNFYDLRDFLSYVAAPIFPGRVTDHQVDNRQPFPESHSAYWKNPAVWETLAKEMP